MCIDVNLLSVVFDKNVVTIPTGLEAAWCQHQHSNTRNITRAAIPCVEFCV